MKVSILSSVLLAVCINSPGQQGAAPAPAGGQASPAQPAQPAQPGSAQGQRPPQTTLPPGLQGRDQLPPGLAGRDQLPPGLAGRTNQFGIGSNQFTLNTNDFAAATNQFGLGTNQFAATNRFRGFTNRFNPMVTGVASNRAFGTNAFGTNMPGPLRDQAFSATDRILLNQIRQRVLSEMRVIGGTPISAGARSPVHFLVRDSTVTLVGVVTGAEEQQRLLGVVQGVPGVAQVVDNLQVRSLDQGFTDTDRALLTQVRQTLNPLLASSSTSVPVQFTARDGVVTLVGVVPSADQRQQFEALASQVAGVVRVDNRLTVNPAAARGLTPTGRPTALPGTNVVLPGTNVVLPPGRTP